MKHSVFTLLLLSTLIFNINPANASGFWSYLFTPDEADHDRAYMNEWKNAYNSDWEYPDWTPQNWAPEGKNIENTINGFYKAGIVTDQYTRGDIPVLEVGQSFLELSGRDQRRVVEFMDYAYGITSNVNAMHVVLKRGCTPLGIYTNEGLQLH